MQAHSLLRHNAPAQEILSYLHAEGLELAPVEGKTNRILVSPSEILTDEHRRLIRAHKPELLALLTGRPMPVPPLPHTDLEDIHEAIMERAAVREFDGGEPRHLAEHHAIAAMRVYQVLVAMDPDQPARWIVLICPGCNLEEATASAHGHFGPDRVLIVRPRPFTHLRQSCRLTPPESHP